MGVLPVALAVLVLGQGEAPRAELGKPVPDLALKDLKRKAWRLSDFRADEGEARAGKVVLVNFWSSTCPVMAEYEERLARLHKDYAEKGVQFLFVASNFNEPRQDLEETAKSRGVEVPILLDPDSKAADLFGARTTPHVFILDRKGVLRYSGHVDNKKKPGAEGRVAYAEEALAAVLKGEEVKVPRTEPHGCAIKRAKKK